MLNQNIFQNKIETLKAFERFDAATIDKFAKILTEQDDWDLLRINPLRFAKQHNFEETECVDLFIHAAKIGLFDFSYNMLCPGCGGIAHSHYVLDDLAEDTFHCYMCNIDVPTVLDGQIEVSFTIQPDVKDLKINPYQNADTYYRYHFSANYERQALMRPELVKVNLNILEPDETVTIVLSGAKDYMYNLVSVGYRTSCRFLFDVEEDTQVEKNLEVNILPTGFTPTEVHLPVDTYQLKVHNRTKNRFEFLVKNFCFSQMKQMVRDDPPFIHPFLTASALINNQSFRDLFRVQRLSENLNLNVNNLTIMFTDLKGSTAMYDEAGDMFAYKMIKEHFKLLTESVRNHAGALVKTMGDAIMATFVSPLNGFLCALDMIQKIDKFNTAWEEQGYQIGLKVGLHTGAALTVVNDERLDYFGQSVNIAARIQALAGASEIYLSDSIYQAADIKQILPQYGYTSKREEASLRGIGEPVSVYKVFKTDK